MNTMVSLEVSCLSCIVRALSFLLRAVSMMTLVMLRQASMRNFMVVLQSSSFCMMTELGPYLSLMRSLSSKVFRNVSSLSILTFFSVRSLFSDVSGTVDGAVVLLLVDAAVEVDVVVVVVVVVVLVLFSSR